MVLLDDLGLCSCKHSHLLIFRINTSSNEFHLGYHFSRIEIMVYDEHLMLNYLHTSFQKEKNIYKKKQGIFLAAIHSDKPGMVVVSF